MAVNSGKSLFSGCKPIGL